MTDAEEGADLIQPGLPVGGTIDFLRLIWAVDHALQRRSRSMAAAAVQRTLHCSTKHNLDGARAVLSNLARELDGGPPMRRPRGVGTRA